MLTVVCVASSGFEESARRCPTICGSCSTGVYPGCNGVAGSGRTVDSCGVCGGQNTLCQQPCGIQALQQCTRTVSISAGLAQSSDQKCRLHVRALGGRALLGQIMVTEDDCGTSLPAYQVNGFAELRTCVAAQPQCTSVDAATFAENTCTRRRQVFDSAAWQHYCPSFNASRTSFECNMSLPNFDSYSSSLPDDVGVYSLTVSRALANGMFGNSSLFRGCPPGCLYDVVAPQTTAWQWMQNASCWKPVGQTHQCLQHQSFVNSAMAASAVLLVLPWFLT